MARTVLVPELLFVAIRLLPESVTLACLSLGFQAVFAIGQAVTFGPTCRLLTAVGVHPAPVAGSLASVRHSQLKPVPSVVEPELTVVPPDLACTVPERDPASDFCAKARV